MSAKERTIVLNHEQIALILERFAHQIYEQHHKEKELVLLGIGGRGEKVASRIHGHLKKISDQTLKLEKIELDKSKPLEKTIELSLSASELSNKVIILIDDVLNSGKTMIHAVKSILDAKVRSISTVVVVDRIHRDFPIRADIVGMTLSTTLQERVELELGKKDYAYLV
jgi:pyrimidine operon attenuation protein/uracil phosphoribosyltransferase